jgi:RNA polymerase sigma-70 factor (ECF subfamily)
MPPTGDRDRALPGADQRFERCFRDNYAAILAFAIRRMPDRGTAEDAAAETFTVAWRRRDLIPAEPLPWLYGIALRVIANQRRSTRRRRRLGDRLERETPAQPPRRNRSRRCRTATPSPAPSRD